MKILITGVAGLIGYHLAQRLLAEGNQVYGIDNLNDYYCEMVSRLLWALLKSDRYNQYIFH
jgi:nucleoside-diphosphate-sugar epimerase